MRTGLVSWLLVLAFALAGCSGGDDGGSDGSDGSDGNDGGSGGGGSGDGDDGGSGGGGSGDGDDGGSGGGGDNSPPGPETSASPTQGGAPLSVNFTYDATDVDSDPLTWTFDFDGDGTPELEGTEADLPGNHTFAYESAGNYTAVFEVSDGVNEPVNDTWEITVTEGGGGGGGSVEDPGPHGFTGSVTLVDPTIVAGETTCKTGVIEQSPFASADGGNSDKPGDFPGFHWRKADGVDGLRVEFYDADGGMLGDATTLGAGPAPLPEGAKTMYICGSDPSHANSGSYKVEILHESIL